MIHEKIEKTCHILLARNRGLVRLECLVHFQVLAHIMLNVPKDSNKRINVFYRQSLEPFMKSTLV